MRAGASRRPSAGDLPHLVAEGADPVELGSLQPNRAERVSSNAARSKIEIKEYPSGSRRLGMHRLDPHGSSHSMSNDQNDPSCRLLPTSGDVRPPR